MRAGVPGAGLKVCAGDAGSHPERGAAGGAEMTYREDMSPSTQPDGRASSLSPRYFVKSRDIVNPCPGTLFTF